MKTIFMLIFFYIAAVFNVVGYTPDCILEANRDYVISTLSSYYGYETALKAEAKMTDIMQNRGLTSIDLLATMWIECRYDHTAVNKFTGATGIIQFMPSTIGSLSVLLSSSLTYTQVRNMGLLAQLELADVYFHYNERYVANACIETTEDLYVAILAPAFLNKYRGDTLYHYTTQAYKLNQCLDQLPDGGITRQDLEYYLYNIVPFGDRLRTNKWMETVYNIDAPINLGVSPCATFDIPLLVHLLDQPLPQILVVERMKVDIIQALQEHTASSGQDKDYVLIKKVLKAVSPSMWNKHKAEIDDAFAQFNSPIAHGDVYMFMGARYIVTSIDATTGDITLTSLDGSQTTRIVGPAMLNQRASKLDGQAIKNSLEAKYNELQSVINLFPQS